ncbi:hypothetical protein R1flu_004013 [Riccia fluitans]|uniref:Uncharacterized protein n=1 Tax=Riccia fluitans TaxID=41844 RepID=A0ABD1YQ19_9MARC
MVASVTMIGLEDGLTVENKMTSRWTLRTTSRECSGQGNRHSKTLVTDPQGPSQDPQPGPVLTLGIADTSVGELTSRCGGGMIRKGTVCPTRKFSSAGNCLTQDHSWENLFWDCQLVE